MDSMMIQLGYRTTVRILGLYVTRDCRGEEEDGDEVESIKKIEDGETARGGR